MTNLFKHPAYAVIAEEGQACHTAFIPVGFLGYHVPGEMLLGHKPPECGRKQETNTISITCS